MLQLFHGLEIKDAVIAIKEVGICVKIIGTDIVLVCRVFYHDVASLLIAQPDDLIDKAVVAVVIDASDIGEEGFLQIFRTA